MVRAGSFGKRVFFLGMTAHAGKDLGNNFSLLGRHFHTGQCLASCVVLRQLFYRLPCGYVSVPWDQQHARVKLWVRAAFKACSPVH